MQESAHYAVSSHSSCRRHCFTSASSRVIRGYFRQHEWRLKCGFKGVKPNTNKECYAPENADLLQNLESLCMEKNYLHYRVYQKEYRVLCLLHK
ncbi:hypothetical protein CEXT_10881 [Caerostris extrusa]|uniref:Uncharacterized protein n=1 Tax=Caerostris extrusa TaxID=172846 RepID=A0AAV4NT95_CAEEX|nr:hypothetical protein CEXT_10881 [Caerostris extrusa]